MTTFKEMLASDVTNVHLSEDDYAVEVTYYENDVAKTVSAIVDFGEQWDEESGGVSNEITLEVSAADISSPQYRDKVTVTMPDGSSVDWYLLQREYGDGFVWRLKLVQEERPKL